MARKKVKAREKIELMVAIAKQRERERNRRRTRVLRRLLLLQAEPSLPNPRICLSVIEWPLCRRKSRLIAYWADLPSIRRLSNSETASRSVWHGPCKMLHGPCGMLYGPRKVLRGPRACVSSPDCRSSRKLSEKWSYTQNGVTSRNLWLF